jgi:DNA-binding IclR family transcriptional regulator
MVQTIIKSLARGLTILAKIGKPVTLNDVAAHFSLDRSSVFRLVKTMVKAGFISQNSEMKAYKLGFTLLELAGCLSENLHLEEFLCPFKRQVCAKTEQNTHLAVLDGQEVIFIAVEQPCNVITVSISIGTREPATHTALGRAILDFFDTATVEKILDGASLKRFTDRSIAR